MADILLLEPNYSNKYPPLGLMKISYFHKEIRKDFVKFSKGPLDNAFKDKKWDRVYVTTLFTFEWEATKKTIEYAISVAKDKNMVFVGGILATLMPEKIRENFGLEPCVGQLNRVGTIGLEGEETIDIITPDYSMLEDIKDTYIYPAHDAYFLYMTRGCGMKCAFCAVQTLEPKYIPYISIKEQVRRIERKYGTKKDLLLMDNNVLRSPRFDEIIDEIIELGFGKGAKCKNPKTGKMIHRYVDFNQGLDAFLLTEHKAKRLGELAIRPARIAFDHFEDKDKYVEAIKMCARNSITYMSNYLLYNGDEFTGKGRSYQADTPEHLFQRMELSMNLGDELNNTLSHKVAIFSFPMRYIPLSATKRGYVGAKWNGKYLRALQTMLIPTQGKGVSSRSFFEADFGATKELFIENLAMPEYLLSIRGHFVKRDGEIKSETDARYAIWQENHEHINEWRKLYNQLVDKEDLLKVIKDNDFSIESFQNITDSKVRKIFIHYLSRTVFLKALATLKEKAIIEEIISYICSEFPLYYKKLVSYVYSTKIPYSSLAGIIITMGDVFIKDVFLIYFDNNMENSFIIDSLFKAQKLAKKKLFDYDLLKITSLYNDAKMFNRKEYGELRNIVLSNDMNSLREILKKKYKKFSNAVYQNNNINFAGGNVCAEIEQVLNSLYEQLSILQ